MILDKLLEKKDLLAYLDLRKKFLHEIKNGEILKLPVEDRESVKERFDGRIAELEILAEVLKSGELKDKAKWYFRTIKKMSEKKELNKEEVELVNGDKKTVVLDEETIQKIKQIKDKYPPSFVPDDEELIKDGLELYLKELQPKK